MIERVRRLRPNAPRSGPPKLTVVPPAPAKTLTTRKERLGGSTLERLFPSFFGGDGGISKIELAMFSRQLATFIAAGVPITQALGVIAEETKSGSLRRAMRRVLEDLGEGLSVAESFARYPKMFSPLYVNMVRAAELTGNLDAVLRRLDQHLSREDALAKKIKNALAYPIVVLFMSLGSLVVLITFVLPQFATLFGELKTELPPTTKILLGVANFATTQRTPLAAGFIAFIAFLVLSQRIELGRYLKDAFFLRMPVVGGLSRYAAVARFARTLSTMLAAGVPVARSLDTVISASANRVFQRKLLPVKERVLAGEGFAGPLGETRLFPPTVVQMVRVGEETGSLDKFLSETADYYDAELEYRLTSALALLEPALMIGVGGIVGFIAISLVGAVYSMTSTFK